MNAVGWAGVTHVNPHDPEGGLKGIIAQAQEMKGFSKVIICSKVQFLLPTYKWEFEFNVLISYFI